MSRDPFVLLANEREDAFRTVRRTLGDHSGAILLSVCVLLTAALPLVILELANPFSAEFFMRTAYTGLTSYLCYLLFLPEGKRGEIGCNPAYGKTAERLDRLAAAVRAGLLSAFAVFCRETAAREAEERRQEYLSLHTGEGGEPSARCKRHALRIHPRPISPTRILCGAGRGRLSDAGRRHLSASARGAILRPVLILGTAILFSSVSILPGAGLDLATAVRILCGILGVTMAAFAGYTAGACQVREEITAAEHRILFLSSFLESRKITTEQ
jgi:hypothetical protein